MEKDNKDWSFEIDHNAPKPKYLQIVDAIEAAVLKGELTVERPLPSVNYLLRKHDISRDTVVKAYEKLKKLGVVESVPGKGYFAKKEKFQKAERILLIFNKLSQHKKIIYDSFTNTLGEGFLVDFYIYNNDVRLFKSLLRPRLSEAYSYYVIIGHFLNGGLSAIDIINDIPKNKLIVLDKNIKGITGSYASVFQDFETDIFQVLSEATAKLQKYEKLKLIFPSYTYQPKEIVSGFIKYCNSFKFPYELVTDLEEHVLQASAAYVVTMEDDLVTLIKKLKQTEMTAGKDVGIISYNETPLKEILLEGITTISTDFVQLGSSAADLVKSGEKLQIKNPFHITFRKSL